MLGRLLDVNYELWAQHFSVYPDGSMGSDGESATRPTAAEASALSQDHTDIAWVNFSLFVTQAGQEEEYPVGETFIATCENSISRTVKFEPVSAVVAQGRLTVHTTKWVGYLATAPPLEPPNSFDDLVALLK